MTQRLSPRLPWVIVAVMLLALTLSAQQTTVTGGLNGVITDATGAVVPGATVVLSGPQGSQTLTTDTAGRYSAAGLVPGYYDVKVKRSGFKEVESKHNQVVVNSSSSLNLTLAIGDASEVVEVSDTAVSIDTQSTAITQNLTDTFYQSVPMQRNVTSIFYAAPGVVQGQVSGQANLAGPGANNPSIEGATGMENLYVVDGVNLTEQSFGTIGTYNRNYGSLGTGINLSYVKEVDVKTSAFEPQYGKALGGIIQIVTKSGSNQYHGGLGVYLGPGSWQADPKRYSDYNYAQTYPSTHLSTPSYELSGEFGGYVPGLKDKLFFFGAVNPQFNQTVSEANPNNTVTFAHGPYKFNTTVLGWAGKLTYKLGDTTTIEASSFGDPERRNNGPNTLSTSDPNSVSSAYQYGSRDSSLRVNTTITPTWVADASFGYSYNHFKEQLKEDQFATTDESGSMLNIGNSTTGFGQYYPSNSDTYNLAFNTTKTFNFLGQHTVSAGYSYDHTNFTMNNARSGGLFALPTVNAAGTNLQSLFSNIPDRAVGALTNAVFYIYAANPDATLTTTDTTCTSCSTNSRGQQVYASIYRGSYAGFLVTSSEHYHAGYLNDVYQINKYVTLNAGARWEEERVAGSTMSYNFGSSWSPRLGINIDPFGDKKGKIFFNYSREFWAMPLDAAIRQLGNEQDDTGYVFAANQDATGNYTVDLTKNLNGMPAYTDASSVVHNFGAPNFGSSTGEGIIPGTKGEYQDEFVIGFERELPHQIVIKARYTDRKLRRIIEDVGSNSVEGQQMTSNYNGGITNPNPKTDIAVNEQEVTYTPAQWTAANPASKGTITASNYDAPVSGCSWSTDTYKALGGLFINGLNQQVGGACFLNLASMDNGPGDGIADGFPQAVRHYQAFEFELDKRYSNNWMAVANLRIGDLWGNYEGAYRNDNGQDDPGISSLFDYTLGKLGLLDGQYTKGYLSTDRRVVANLYLSYTVSSDTPFINKAKGLTVGLSMTGQSGVPLSKLGTHPAYLNQGEVTIGGRGSVGRTASNTVLNMHLGYDLPLSKSATQYKLKLAMDMFNLTNSQAILSQVQYTQNEIASVGATPTLDTDYGKPTAFQAPFSARAQIRVEF